MNKRNKFICIIFLQIFVFIFFLVPTSDIYAIDYQKASLGETIRLGEFVYNDDYTSSVADCSIIIYNSVGSLKIGSTLMNVNPNGWHYYDYAIGSGETLGNWPASMSCGSALGGDLIIVDKTFTVIPAVTTTNNAVATSVWSNSIRKITSLFIDDGSGESIAKQSDLTAIKAKTDTIDWTDVTAVKSNLASLITEVGTGNISAIKTKTDTIDWANVTGIVTSNGLIKAKTDTIAWADVTGIKTKTDTIDWTNITGIKTKTDTIVWGDVTTVKTNLASLITEVGTGNISAIKTKTDTIDWANVTGIVTSNGLIKAKTDTIAWADVTGIKTKTDTILWTDVTGIKTKTDSIAWGDVTTLGLTASAIKAKTDTIDWTDITSLPTNIWAYSGRTLTSMGTLASDIWSNTTRTLTSLTLSSQSPWSVSMSDFGTITAGSTYMTTVTTIYNGTLTDALNVPTITIYDPNRNVVVNGASMTRTSVGSYGYSYITNVNSAGGVWESVISANVETGKTLPGNDFWNVSTAPPQVIILDMNSIVTPTVSANVRITNEGSIPYEYQYEWCVVTDLNNPCGGGNDVFYSSAAKLINPGSNFDTTLSSTVLNTGNYFFKVAVFYGTEKSGSTRSFITTSPTNNGGGGGNSNYTPAPIIVGGVCKGADFNHDNKVNSIDFSIILSFWKTNSPFLNPCVDINKDKKVNSIDFSILLSQWGTAGAILTNKK